MSLEYISLLVDNTSIVNGFGKSVKTSETILGWSVDLRIFQAYLAAGKFPEGYSLFIPDFWHITHGGAKCLPKVEAEELWDSTIDARKALTPFITGTEMVLTPHPGTRFHLKNNVPYETI